jgi:hypothetical protein
MAWLIGLQPIARVVCLLPNAFGGSWITGLGVLCDFDRGVTLNMSELPKLAYNGMRTPTKEPDPGHENDAVTKRRRMAKVNCDGMNVNPSILGYIANCVERDSNFLEVIRYINCDSIGPHFLESRTTPQNKCGACNPSRQELPFHRRWRRSVALTVKCSEKQPERAESEHGNPNRREHELHEKSLGRR